MIANSNPQGFSDVVLLLTANTPQRLDYGGHALEVLSYTGDPLQLRAYAGNQSAGHAEVFEVERATRISLASPRVVRFDYLDVIDTAGGGLLKLRVYHHRAVVVPHGDAPSLSRRQTLAYTPQTITWAGGSAGVWDLALAPDSLTERAGMVELLTRGHPSVGDAAAELPFWDGWISCTRDFDFLVFASTAWNGVGAASDFDFRLVQRFQSNTLGPDGTHGDPATSYPELFSTTNSSNVVNLADAFNITNNSTGSGVHADIVGNPAKIPVGNLRCVLTWAGATQADFRFWIGRRG